MAQGVQRFDAVGQAPAWVALHRVIARCTAVMRGVTGLAAGIVALLSMSTPATVEWLLPAVAITFGWAGLFAWVAWRWGLTLWLISGEILLTVGFCLTQERLVAAELLADGASWVAGVVTMTIVATSLAWPPQAAVLAGLAVAVAHLVGAQAAGAADGGYTAVGINIVQVAATAVLGVLIRNAARTADVLLARLRDFEERATVERARRTDERIQNSRMHGSFLATLMVIGAGGIKATSPMLRQTAAGHLAELERIAQASEPGTDLVALDELLHGVTERAAVKVEKQLAPVTVPRAVADAFAEAVGESLANVHRHAGTDTAEVRLTSAGSQINVAIADHGTGFDHAAVPDHRYGVRVSIIGRLKAVGGTATVSSDATGTRIELTWRS